MRACLARALARRRGARRAQTLREEAMRELNAVDLELRRGRNPISEVRDPDFTQVEPNARSGVKAACVLGVTHVIADIEHQDLVACAPWRDKEPVKSRTYTHAVTQIPSAPAGLAW